MADAKEFVYGVVASCLEGDTCGIMRFTLGVLHVRHVNFLYIHRVCCSITIALLAIGKV